MDAVSFLPGDSQANPDILAAIIRASETYSIVASQDIVDVRGLKLWAKGLPVSAALQQRLLERKLRNPIESCLMAEDGVTPFYLLEQLNAFLDSEHSMAQALFPSAVQLQKQLKQIPLHSVAQGVFGKRRSLLRSAHPPVVENPGECHRTFRQCTRK